MSLETDKAVVRRAYTDPTPIGKGLLRSLTFEMAETRLAAANWFWSDEKQLAPCPQCGCRRHVRHRPTPERAGAAAR